MDDFLKELSALMEKHGVDFDIHEDQGPWSTHHDGLEFHQHAIYQDNQCVRPDEYRVIDGQYFDKDSFNAK